MPGGRQRGKSLGSRPSTKDSNSITLKLSGFSFDIGNKTPSRVRIVVATTLGTRTVDGPPFDGLAIDSICLSVDRTKLQPIELQHAPLSPPASLCFRHKGEAPVSWETLHGKFDPTRLPDHIELISPKAPATRMKLRFQVEEILPTDLAKERLSAVLGHGRAELSSQVMAQLFPTTTAHVQSNLINLETVLSNAQHTVQDRDLLNLAVSMDEFVTVLNSSMVLRSRDRGMHCVKLCEQLHTMTAKFQNVPSFQLERAIDCRCEIDLNAPRPAPVQSPDYQPDGTPGRDYGAWAANVVAAAAGSVAAAVAAPIAVVGVVGWIARQATKANVKRLQFLRDIAMLRHRIAHTIWSVEANCNVWRGKRDVDVVRGNYYRFHLATESLEDAISKYTAMNSVDQCTKVGNWSTYVTDKTKEADNFRSLLVEYVATCENYAELARLAKQKLRSQMNGQ